MVRGGGAAMSIFFRNIAARRRSFLCVIAYSVWLSSSAAVIADSKPATDIPKLLAARCNACHGPDKQEGGLRLDSLAAALKGGDRGPAVVPGNLEKSLLVRAIAFQDPELQMPPKQKLSETEVAELTAWVQSGAEWPAAASSPATPSANAGPPIGDAFTDPRNPIRELFRGERLDLWSLRKPVESAPVRTAEAAHPIDAFVRQRLAESGLQQAPEADRRTLIRRLTLDLIGLPPTPEDVARFVSDQSPDAYEQLVERLLSSPHYGERQARLWLDVVRYADTNGYERDEYRPLAWQYRDYVVRAFNQDKPFDQFVREQLAGDELLGRPPETDVEADQLIATGFLRLGQWDSTAPIFQEQDRQRAEDLADMTNATASAFLGLTMACCQCHDHKYDPLSQADHYRLRAFFSAAVPRDDLTIDFAAARAEVDAYNVDFDRQIKELERELAKINKADKEKRTEVRGRIEAVKAKRRHPQYAMGVADTLKAIPATHVLHQGDYLQPREEVTPGFVSVLWPDDATIERPGEMSTGRRLALANWIVSAENPWTARVFVNRIWQQHFGVGIVATANDFGFAGAQPTHPELLDWLALRFISDGWSTKDLHRLIVTSATYRQSIRETADGRRLDPENRLLARQSVRRIDAETLRDSLLVVSGLLNESGSTRPVWPPMSDELRKAQPAILESEKGDDGGRMQGWYSDPIEQTNVRSLYLIRKRCLPIPFLQAFDLPDTTVSCARRDSTIVAPQALMLLNSDDVVRYAEAFAKRVADRAGNDPARQVEFAFQQALGRSPDHEELSLSVEHLRRSTEATNRQKDIEKTSNEVLVDFCRALFNLNEFAFVD
jgi:mono/diheme cytochrome c family protein